jgi:hypothetical protein
VWRDWERNILTTLGILHPDPDPDLDLDALDSPDDLDESTPRTRQSRPCLHHHNHHASHSPLHPFLLVLGLLPHNTLPKTLLARHKQWQHVHRPDFRACHP